MSVRATRNAEVRRRITEAALAQVSEGGYASASVAAVAQRAGIAAGSVYTHFPSKGDLFAQVFREAAGAEQAVITAIASDRTRPPRERLAATTEAFARRALAAPALSWALLAEPVDPAVEEARLESKRGYRDVFSALLSEGVEAGDFAPLDAATAAAAIVGALQEAMIGPLAAKRVGREPLVASLVQFVLGAVGANEDGRSSHGRRTKAQARNA